MRTHLGECADEFRNPAIRQEELTLALRELVFMDNGGALDAGVIHVIRNSFALVHEFLPGFSGVHCSKLRKCVINRHVLKRAFFVFEIADADVVSALKLGDGPSDVFASRLTIDTPNDVPRMECA